VRVRTSIAMLAGSALTLAITQPWQQPDPTVITETYIRHHIDEVLTTVDLEELRSQVDDLNIQLDDECVLIAARITGEPEQGIRNYVDRHYDGDACQYAEDAQSADY